MSDVHFSSGPPSVVLDPEPKEALLALASAREHHDPVSAIAAVCARWPKVLAAWADLGEALDDPVLAYAAYRTGYHRGLDRLRANGWRGSGFVLWQHESNRAFLRSLAGLQNCAALIGETDEEQRCAHFLRQLDPQWPPQN